MTRFTESNMRAVLARIVELTGEPMELGRWAPGDGRARYRIEQGGNNPFGSRYWMGRTEAYWGMQSIAAALEYAERKAKAVQS